MVLLVKMKEEEKVHPIIDSEDDERRKSINNIGIISEDEKTERECLMIGGEE